MYMYSQTHTHTHTHTGAARHVEQVRRGDQKGVCQRAYSALR